MTADPRFSRPTISALAVAVLILAITFAFLVGRASVVPARAPGPEAGPPAANRPVEPPAWSAHGFRDDQSVPDSCVTSDCNG
jgi:hypothetical protein